MNTQPNQPVSPFIATTPGFEEPFQTWQDIYPNQIRIKLTQEDIKDLLDVGFVSSLKGQELVNQFILREYFTGDVFEQLADFHRVGSSSKKYVYFRISTALALHGWLAQVQDKQSIWQVSCKLKKALINQKLIRL